MRVCRAEPTAALKRMRNHRENRERALVWSPNLARRTAEFWFMEPAEGFEPPTL
jgi:hypothetical protein